jgi:stress-induced morphogen
VQQQISGELMQSMKEKIRDALSAELVEVTDTYGDGRHVSIDVVAKVFEGESTMKRYGIWYMIQDRFLPIPGASNMIISSKRMASKLQYLSHVCVAKSF